jgi:hypothetical protein
MAVVWTATALITALAPDLVSGSGSHHVPLPALTAWIWATAASGFLSLPRSSHLSTDAVTSIALVWGAALFMSVSAPELVVDDGATWIPVTACVAPAFAAVATGYVVLASVVRGRRVTPELHR